MTHYFLISSSAKQNVFWEPHTHGDILISFFICCAKFGAMCNTSPPCPLGMKVEKQLANFILILHTTYMLHLDCDFFCAIPFPFIDKKSQKNVKTTLFMLPYIMAVCMCHCVSLWVLFSIICVTIPMFIISHVTWRSYLVWILPVPSAIKAHHMNELKVTQQTQTTVECG